MKKYCHATLLIICLGGSFCSGQKRSPAQMIPAPPKDSFTPQLRTLLDLGAGEYKAGHYDKAITLFQQARALDASNRTVATYLAVSFGAQVVPNDMTQANQVREEKAMQAFQDVLRIYPYDVDALRWQATLYYDMQNYVSAKSLQKQVFALKSGDSVAAYTVGVIDWTLAYFNATQILSSEQIKDDGAGNLGKSSGACSAIQKLNAPLIQDGMYYLDRAIRINPKYEDAMVYMNLLYRRKADLDCGDMSATGKDIAQANYWTQMALAARNKNQESSQHAEK
jgi:tetratricopeptide (TPR) repeat protein